MVVDICGYCTLQRRHTDERAASNSPIRDLGRTVRPRSAKPSWWGEVSEFPIGWTSAIEKPAHPLQDAGSDVVEVRRLELLTPYMRSLYGNFAFCGKSRFYLGFSPVACSRLVAVIRR